jgi:hypothetical protein
VSEESHLISNTLVRVACSPGPPHIAALSTAELCRVLCRNVLWIFCICAQTIRCFMKRVFSFNVELQKNVLSIGWRPGLKTVVRNIVLFYNTCFYHCLPTPYTRIPYTCSEIHTYSFS